MRCLVALLLSLFFHLEAYPLPIHEAFVSKFTDVSAPAVIAKMPPTPLIENVPAQPTSDLTWIGGYWMWLDEKNDFEWICGVWRRPPPKQTWISGGWQKVEGGWIRERGFWSSHPANKLIKFQKPPPASIEDQVPPTPGDGYFWVPGYWAFSYDSKDYVWLSGKWERFHDSWVLSPASYIWRQSGYIFVPFYWDWALKDRGVAYTCNEFTGPKVIKQSDIVHHLYSYYPDFLTFYWHCWHFHPHWWDGCNCIPSWWLWPSWWTFSWNNSWGCWWWWTHPGSLPPAWMTYDLSMKIAPPSYAVMDRFNFIKRPPFVIKEGTEPLAPLAEGNVFNNKLVPRPSIPSDVTPAGTVKFPPLPVNQGVQITFSEQPKNKAPRANNWPPQRQENSAYYPGDPGFKNPRYSDHPPSNASPSAWNFR